MAAIRKMKNKNGDSYQIQVKAKNPATGKLVIKCKTWRPNTPMTIKQMEREVVIVADKFEKEIRESVTGLVGSGNEIDMTLKEYYISWLERRKPDLALNTYVHYSDTLKILDEYIGGVKLRDLTPFIIQSFYDKLDKFKKVSAYAIGKPKFKIVQEKKGLNSNELARRAEITPTCVHKSRRGERIQKVSAEKIAKALCANINTIYEVTVNEEPYCYETMHKHKRNIRAVLATAKKQRIISDNYASADYITFGRRPETKIDFMDDDESKIFYKALMVYKDIRSKTAMLILLFTGMRRGELAGLNWADIDLEKDTIKIERAYTAVKGYGVILKEPKTKSSKRLIAISKLLCEQLKEYKDWVVEERVKYGDRWKESDALFTNEIGERVYPQTFNMWLDYILVSAGLRHYSLHSLRHTNITLQIMAGVPLAIVSGRAGHARTSTTADIYTHFIKSVDKQAAEKLNSLFM